MKLRMLNGSHSFLRIWVILLDISTLMTVWKMNISSCGVWLDVAGTSADAESAGVDLQDYANRLIARYSNPAFVIEPGRLRWMVARNCHSGC